jgi:endo-1,4-beta-xylanase
MKVTVLAAAMLAAAVYALGAQEALPSLKKAFAPFFAIGVAVQPSFLDAINPRSTLIASQFSALVAENCMKPEALQPSEGTFRFKDADKLALFARKNGMALRGHTLVWHQQTPLWFFSDPDQPSKDASRDLLLERMKVHIQTVVAHFRGKVRAWDVVNEALSDSSGLRTGTEHSKWYEILGPEYIDRAFEYAHEADPEALLVINDYNLESSPVKREAMYDLVHGMLSRGVPVGAIGLQMHVSLYSPSVESVRQAIERFASLGVKVQVTELDVSLYSGSEAAKPIDDALLRKQADRYGELFSLFKEEAAKGNLDMVMLWGLSDDQSWLNNFPVAGRTNAPLLFDQELAPKQAFWTIIHR